LRNRKLLFLSETGQQDEARTILTTRLKAAEKAVEENPDDATALLDLIFLLKGDSQLADELDSDDADEKQQEFLDRLRTVAEAHLESVPLVITALGEQLSAVGSIARKKPLEAEKQLQSLKEFTESIESEDPAVKSRLASIRRSIPSIERAIESGKFHLSLIGKEAVPLEAEAWVNGEPLTDSDLKGKVVLLDFWAVWCGPCIATFPHLREWREEYEDKGLVIIGVTRYYNYGWDEEAKRAKKTQEEITPEEEQAAMLKFAEHYELQHRFMITPKDATFQKEYGVSGIPQAVLIDREGKIRLIRIGSSDANAEEIDAMLAELIGDGQ
jgi:thiol-disulfide isomerase/thioredoxin